MTAEPLPAETRIGHVHLKVADLDRAIGFYHDTLGFDLLMNFGTAAFLSAGGYHHHRRVAWQQCSWAMRQAPRSVGGRPLSVRVAVRTAARAPARGEPRSSPAAAPNT